MPYLARRLEGWFSSITTKASHLEFIETSENGPVFIKKNRSAQEVLCAVRILYTPHVPSTDSPVWGNPYSIKGGQWGYGTLPERVGRHDIFGLIYWINRECLLEEPRGGLSC